MPASKATIEQVQKMIETSPIFMASKTYCPYCQSAQRLISSKPQGKKAIIWELDQMANGDEIQDALLQITGQRTVPNIFIAGKHIGGNSDLQTLESTDKLDDLLAKL